MYGGAQKIKFCKMCPKIILWVKSVALPYGKNPALSLVGKISHRPIWIITFWRCLG